MITHRASISSCKSRPRQRALDAELAEAMGHRSRAREEAGARDWRFGHAAKAQLQGGSNARVIFVDRSDGGGHLRRVRGISLGVPRRARAPPRAPP